MTKKRIPDTMEYLAKHTSDMDALWAEIEPMVLAIEISDYNLDDCWTFENKAETLMRLFCLSVGIKPSKIERFNLLYEVFARYLMRQHRIMKRLLAARGAEK